MKIRFVISIVNLTVNFNCDVNIWNINVIIIVNYLVRCYVDKCIFVNIILPNLFQLLSKVIQN